MRAAPLRLVLWLAVLLGAGTLAYFNFAHQRPSSGIDFGAPFKLSSTKGGVFDSAALQGKPWGLFFGFTHCPEVCPTTLNDISVALKELGPAAKDFQLVFITVDPEQDTALAMRDYLSNFDPRIEGLVPTLSELEKTARDFHIYYKKVPASDGTYTMDHTATLFLFGADGKLKSTVSFDEDKAARLAKLKMVIGR